MKYSGFILGLICFLGVALSPAQAVQTPVFTLNSRGDEVDVAKMAQIVIEYDVRPVQGQKLELYVEEMPIEKKNAQLMPLTVFDKPFGRMPVNFRAFDAGVYVFTTRALDADGNPVADMSRPVYMTYGGMKARDNFNKRLAQQGQNKFKADVFPEVASIDRMPDLASSLKPAAAAIKPGETQRLTFQLGVDFTPDSDTAKKISEDYDTKVYWRLEGEGKLRILSSTEAVYEAPEKGEHVAKVKARILENENECTIYVTEAKLGGELKSGIQPGTE